MEVPMRTPSATRRVPNWTVAAVAGFAGGAVLMVLDLLWSTVVDSGSPWRTSHMIAPIFAGGAPAPASTGHEFSVGMVALALVVHYVMGILAGLVLAAVMTALHLDVAWPRAAVAGAVFGLVLYLFNFHALVRFFPWLADLRGAATITAHLVFGLVVALLYWKLDRNIALGQERR